MVGLGGVPGEVTALMSDIVCRCYVYSIPNVNLRPARVGWQKERDRRVIWVPQRGAKVDLLRKGEGLF